MTAPGILGAFASHPFLAELKERHLMLLASGVRPFAVEPNALLAREGQAAKAFYLVQTGSVAIETPRPGRSVVRVQTVGPGEIVGWSWIVQPYRWQFDARAVERTTGLQLDAEWLREKCEQDHDLGYHLVRQVLAVVSGRLAATRLQVLDLYK